MLSQIHTRDSQALYKLLKGVMCVYKPNGFNEGSVRKLILNKLCTELNEMECRPPINYISIEGSTTRKMKVTVRPSYADDPLIVGPRYQVQDFSCRWALPLGINTSGVFLLGFNDGVRNMTALDRNHQLRTFHLHGQFGRATDTFFTNGKVTERSKFRHVTQQQIDKYLASIQAAHQKSMFELSGVDIRSQDAYELAVKGLIRPADPNVPMIYGIKCIEFNLPDFTIEVHCTNEHEFYLMSLINEIGMKLHSNAVCTKVRCIRHSHFTVHNSILRKHWTLEHIINNIQNNQRIIRNSHHLSPSAILIDAYHEEDRKETLLAPSAIIGCGHFNIAYHATSSVHHCIVVLVQILVVLYS